MKIGLQCSPTYVGPGVVATELGIELAARGHEIHFITYSQPFRLTGREANIRYHEVPVSNYPLFEYPPYDLALATRMAEVAEFHSLDLLHVHYAIPPSVSALLARQMLAARGRHLPFITTLHGTDITLVGLDRSYLPITRFGIDESDGVTAISSYLRDQTRENPGIPRDIEVIRNFVNCDFYVRNPELVAQQRPRFAKPGESLLVHLSNFPPVKRVLDVIETFSRCSPPRPPAHDRRRPRPPRSRVPRHPPRRRRPRRLRRQAGERQRAPRPLRPHAHALRAGVLRPRRTGSHGLLRPRHSHPRRGSTRANR